MDVHQVYDEFLKKFPLPSADDPKAMSEVEMEEEGIRAALGAAGGIPLPPRKDCAECGEDGGKLQLRMSEDLYSEEIE